jgi:predicted ATPase/DNA-binding SARP family transcriptional activator
MLGPLEVSHAGALLALGGPRHRKLLAVLLVNADETVSTGRLIDALWGDDPVKSAPAMLHVRVSELRAALRAGRRDRHAGLLHQGGGYVLRIGADEVDAREFERLAATGADALAGGDPVRAAATLREALARWRGPALAEFAEEPFARAEATRLDALRLQALEHRLEADLASGRHGELVGELEALVTEHPLRERIWGQLMLALYRAGRQGEALAAFQSARHRLADELGIDPGAPLRRLHEAMLRQDPELDPPTAEPGAPAASTGRPPTRDRPPGNLPAQLTSFVGRRNEIAEIRELVRAGRLVTLTGVGGVGKSRVAVEVAAGCAPEFSGGAWLVELAALTQPGLVVHAVAAALGVREHPQRPLDDVLAEHLRAAEVLVVLDNCEHLLAEVAEVADRLLGSCPGLRILATSRERIGLTGEVLRPVSGLGVPAPGAGGAGEVGRAEAVELLLARAAAVQPGFELSEATAPVVAEICRRLDGLPLAIELAAARLNALDVAELAARLDDRFRLLTHASRAALPRHQTLRAVVDWSYELLDDAQRTLFDRLAVFVGGFTLDAVEAVCADLPDGYAVAAELAGLVDKSMVVAESGGAAPLRYRMLETLRAYAWERLDESGQAPALRDRHAAHVLTLVESARVPLRGTRQPQWLRRLEAEHGNIRAALGWSIDRGDAATAMRLAGSLYPLWDQHGHYREGRDWTTRVLAMDAPAPPAARARALNAAAALAVIQGDVGQALAASEQAAALSREAGYPAGLAGALQQLGLVAVYAGDVERAVAMLEESLRNARQAGDRWLEGFTLLFLALAALAGGEYDRIDAVCAQSEAVLRTVGDTEGLAWASVMRGLAAWRLRDHTGAARSLRDGIEGFGSLDHLWGLSVGVFLAGQLAGVRGDHERAVTLLGASEALRESVGAALLLFAQEWLDAALAQARAALTTATVDRAWQAGRAMPPRAAVDLAVREAGLAAPGPPAPPAALTPAAGHE